jgi:hypothetical protein
VLHPDPTGSTLVSYEKDKTHDGEGAGCVSFKRHGTVSVAIPYAHS